MSSILEGGTSPSHPQSSCDSKTGRQQCLSHPRASLLYRDHSHHLHRRGIIIDEQTSTRWPPRAAALRDLTLCPGCFTKLRGTGCPECGLRLDGEKAFALKAVADRMLAADRDRVRLVAEIHADIALEDAAFAVQLRAAQPPEWAATPDAPGAGHADAAGADHAGAARPADPALPAFPAGPTGPTGPAPTPAPASTGPRRSGVQVLLLTVGIVLVSVTAVFFSLVAFFVTSPEVRAGLLVVLSAGVIGVASGLRRRLPGTSEGLAVLGAVILALDGLLLRSQGLFGTRGVDPWLFAGIFSAVAAAALLGTARLTGLRSLTRATLVALPVAALGLGAAVGTDASTRAWAGGSLAAAVWILPALIVRATTGSSSSRHSTLARDAVDRGWIRVTTIAPLVVATFAAFGAYPTAPAGTVVPFVVVVVLWLATALVGLSGRPLRGSRFAAASAGVSLTFLPVSLAFRLDVDDSLLWILPLSTGGASALLAAASALGSRGASRPRIRPHAVQTLRIAAAGALGIPAFLVILELCGTIAIVVGTLGRIASAPLFRSPVLRAAVRPTADDGFFFVPPPLIVLGVAVGALAVCGAVELLRARIGVTAAFRGMGTAALAICALAAALLTGIPLLDVGLTTLVGVVAVGLSLSRHVPVAVRVVAGAVPLPTAVILFVLAPATRVLFIPAVVISLLLLAALRHLAGRSLDPAVARVVRPAITLLGSAALLGASARGQAWWGAADAFGRTSSAAVVATALLLLVLAAVAPLVPAVRRATTADLRVISAAALFSVGIAGSLFQGTPGVPRTGSLVLLAGIAATALVWLFVPVAGRPVERILAAALSSGALIACGQRALGYGDLDTATKTLIASGALLVITLAGRALLGDRRGEVRMRRLAWDLPVAATGLVVAVIALGLGTGWQPLLVLAGAAAAMAWEGDARRILADASPRVQVAWAAAALGTAALWSALSQHGVTVVEAYSLPVAGLLIVIAMAVAALRPLSTVHLLAAPGASTPSGRTVILALGLLAACVPSVVASFDGPPLRPIVVLGVAALAGVGSVLGVVSVLGDPRDSRRFMGLDARPLLGLVGMIGVVAGGTLHTAGAILRDEPGAVDGWAAASGILSVALAVVWALAGARAGGSRSVWRAHRLVLAAPGLVVAGVIVSVVPVLTLISARPDEVVRAVAGVALLSLAAVFSAVALASARVRLGGIVTVVTRLQQMSLGGAAVVALSALVYGITTHLPFEAVTMPVAVAGLVAGGSRLRRDATVSSWRTLGAPLAVLLIPGLLADYVDVQVARLVVVGLLSVAVLLLGVARRLQAPLLVGGGVAVLHAIAQLWPGIVEVTTAVPWWLWAGVGGVLLIVVAATYERRLRDARTLGRTVSSLR